MLLSSGLITAPCGVPCLRRPLRAGRPSRPACRNASISVSTRPSATFSSDPRHQAVVRDRVEVALQVGVHHVDVAPSAARRPAAAHPCSPGRGGSRSCARRSPARRSVPARSAAPSAPPGRAPSGSPAAASPGSPAWGSSAGGSPAAGTSPVRSSSRSLRRFVVQPRSRTSRP